MSYWKNEFVGILRGTCITRIVVRYVDKRLTCQRDQGSAVNFPTRFQSRPVLRESVGIARRGIQRIANAHLQNPILGKRGVCEFPGVATRFLESDGGYEIKGEGCAVYLLVNVRREIVFEPSDSRGCGHFIPPKSPEPHLPSFTTKLCCEATASMAS
jgi:hypothetical protein